MTALVLDIDPIIARLVELAPALVSVAGPAELAAVMESGQRPQAPAAYVTSLGDESQPDGGYSSLPRQHVTAEISVMLAVQNYTLVTRDAAPTQHLRAVLTSIREALIAWQLPGTDEPLALITGRAHDFDSGTLWWEDIYRTTYTIQHEARA